VCDATENFLSNLLSFIARFTTCYLPSESPYEDMKQAYSWTVKIALRTLI
jgi:hypothetical protein